jgi:hypothetical protein
VGVVDEEGEIGARQEGKSERPQEAPLLRQAHTAARALKGGPVEVLPFPFGVGPFRSSVVFQTMARLVDNASYVHPARNGFEHIQKLGFFVR